MKNLKKIHIYSLSHFSFRVGGVFAQEKDKSLAKANEEYADSKFVDAEADYRISNSKFQTGLLHLIILGKPFISKIKHLKLSSLTPKQLKTLNQDLKTQSFS
jgi:hypothetical protein